MMTRERYQPQNSRTSKTFDKTVVDNGARRLSLSNKIFIIMTWLHNVYVDIVRLLGSFHEQQPSDRSSLDVVT